ncbi:gas vesicle protein [Candidatus Nitrosotalea okcheonensis]|uniref:Gas vesicle structural protein n=1 Tax=Candidatus Nitrosotalea okcheonensis TaxID=1903276 RepID=A0A2H1FFJ7_9ARCH|nr:gas vesicle protein [Candidatus Nitrosotalea okcheonensis]SMH71452.1 Gas vesicle structural protein [Candidatus Nitrosotalea okcheonensis]
MSARQLAPQQLTIVDLVDRILDKGVVITGDITISVVGVDLLSLKINLVIASLETAKRYGIKLPWEKWDKIQPKKISGKNSKR